MRLATLACFRQRIRRIVRAPKQLDPYMVSPRRIRRMLRFFGICIPAWTLSPSLGHAEESVIPFVVEYHPQPGCAVREQFSEQLLARTPRLRRAQPGESALRFRVEFTSNGGALAGRLTLREMDGTETTRFVPQASCEELVSAMALIAAVLVGATPDDTHTPRSAAVVPKPTAAPSGSPAPLDQSPPNRLRWTAFGGVGADLEGGVAPRVAGGISVEIGAQLHWGQFISPYVALALLRTSPVAIDDAPRGTALFEWGAVRALMTPFRWPASGPVTLRPLLAFEVGRLTGSGQHTERPASTTIPWYAAGFVMRLQASPVAHLGLVLDGGLVVPLRHDRFYFAPESVSGTVYQIPALAGIARFGVAALFP